MATSTNPVEKAWNKTRGDNPEFQQIDPGFRARLQEVYAAAKAGQPESGIAGLEEFEKEIRAGIKTPDSSGVAAVGQPTVRDAAAVTAEKEKAAEKTPQGSGAQDSEGKALKDAAAANRKVESDEEHSPSHPSAARPMAAEAPGNAEPGEDARSATKTASKSAKHSASKRTATKTASKSTSKKK